MKSTIKDYTWNFIASTLVIFFNGKMKYSNVHVHVFWKVGEKCGCIASFMNIGDLQVFFNYLCQYFSSHNFIIVGHIN